MNELMKNIDEIYSAGFTKIVLSNKRQTSFETSKIVVEPIEIKGLIKYRHCKYIKAQVFFENHSIEDSMILTVKHMEEDFKQLDSWLTGKSISLKFSKKNKLSRFEKTTPIIKSSTTNKAHNRKKNYNLEEGTVIPPLVDIGVMDTSGKIAKAQYSKFKQINRFIEMIDDVISSDVKKMKIVDFGSGKAYLTFVLYYYLTKVRKIKAEITGIDLKAKVVNNCNNIAAKHNYTDLNFIVGDVAKHQIDVDTDMVICLHACDTATDYALYEAIKSDVKHIFSVPCCQHEVNTTIKNDSLNLVLKHGIYKERFASILTDAIRGLILEYHGYKVQMLEFVTLEHSSKNILIRAKKRSVSQKQKDVIKAELDRIIAEFGISQTLYDLLMK